MGYVSFLLFQCLNRQMVSSDLFVLAVNPLQPMFQCLNRQMVSSDSMVWRCSSVSGSFNASIGRWCLQTTPLPSAATRTTSFNASIGRWCLQTGVHPGQGAGRPIVSMPQSADGVFRHSGRDLRQSLYEVFQCLNRQMVSSDDRRSRHQREPV